MITQRTFMILFACGLIILQNADPVKGFLEQLVGEFIEVFIEIPEVMLELTGPLSGPAKKALEEIIGTASKGLPLDRTQVEELLKILKVSSIKDLGKGGVEKLSKVFNITEILKIEQEITTTIIPLR